MKVVLDTNVIISGLLWQGVPGQILKLVETGIIKMCLTPRLLAEIERVLAYPKLSIPLKLTNQQPEGIVQSLEQNSLMLPDSVIPEIIKQDPTDNIILGAALVHQADYVVSGDKHLLKIKNFKGIPIVTPNQLIKQFN